MDSRGGQLNEGYLSGYAGAEPRIGDVIEAAQTACEKASLAKPARTPRSEFRVLRCILVIVSLVLVYLAGCAGGNATETVLHSTTLTWTASTSTVAGYNVYRGVQSGGPYTRINSVLEAPTNYVDNTVQSGQTYYYVVTAVDSNGEESAYSHQVVAVIPIL